MTTYGPASFSLADRLAAADAVLIVKKAELLSTWNDELALKPRELGRFEFEIGRALSGKSAGSVHVTVAQGADGKWPVPLQSPFIAILQSGVGGSDATLVHNSAFAIIGKSFRFAPGIGYDAAAGTGKRISLAELDKTIARLAKERVAADRKFAALEPRLKSRTRHGEMEMPDSSLARLLGPGHESGGAAAKPNKLENTAKR